MQLAHAAIVRQGDGRIRGRWTLDSEGARGYMRENAATRGARGVCAMRDRAQLPRGFLPRSRNDPRNAPHAMTARPGPGAPGLGAHARLSTA